MKKEFGRRKTSPFRDSDLIEYLSHDGKQTYREEIVSLKQLKEELGSTGGSSAVTGPELKNYAGHIVAGNIDSDISVIIANSIIDSRTRALLGGPMPPGYAGGVVENYQVFEMDQYLKASAEENDSNQLLYLEKLDPVAEFGPDYALGNLFQIQNVDDPTAILQKQGLTAGMDIAFVVDGTLSKFRIDAVFQDSGNIYIALNLKFDLVNLNQGGFTSEWSLDTGYDIQNDMTLVPGESTSSFYLSEVRVLNYVNTVSLENVGATETFDDTAEWLPGVFLDNIAIPQFVIPVQSRDYTHLRTHRSKVVPSINTPIDVPRFDPSAADYAVQLWLIREPESVNYSKGYSSRAIIPAIVETDYEVRFDKIKSSYVIKK
jgi:hypothetical protein